jgi:BlaI family transcriptional regulator, penicillinase repressor
MKPALGPIPKPTGSELEILGVLWQTGPATVRQVWAKLDAVKPAGYTTVLKLMQIMAEKGLVKRNEENRAHVYSPVLEREEVQGRMVDDLVERVFGGSASALVMRALSRKRASKKEIAEIRRMLDEAEGGKR